MINQIKTHLEKTFSNIATKQMIDSLCAKIGTTLQCTSAISEDFFNESCLEFSRVVSDTYDKIMAYESEEKKEE